MFNWLKKKKDQILNYFKPQEKVRAVDVVREIPTAIKKAANVASVEPAKGFAQAFARFGISAMEAPNAVKTKQATGKFYKVPFLGRLNSFQSEAQNRVNRGDPLWKAIGNPAMETILTGIDAGAFAKPVVKAAQGFKFLPKEGRLLAKDFSKPLGRTMKATIPARTETLNPNGVFREKIWSNSPMMRTLDTPIRKTGKFKIPAQEIDVPFEWESKIMKKLSRPGLNLKNLSKSEKLSVAELRKATGRNKKVIDWLKTEKQASKKSLEKINPFKEGQLSSEIEYLKTKGAKGLKELFEGKKAGTLDPKREKQLTREVDKILKKLMPRQSESGRSLNVQKKKINLDLELKEINKIAQESGDERLKSFADYLSKNKERDPDIIDKIIEFRTSGLLSSPRTFLRNIIGNTTATALKTPEKATAGILDWIRSKSTGKPREVFAGEAIQDLKGMFSKNNAFKNLKKSFKNEDFSSMSRLGELPRFKAIKGKTGKVVRLPYRFTNAPDELFRTANIAGEKRALAYRLGKQKELKGQKLTEWIKGFKPNTQQEEEIMNKALERTFQNPSRFATKIQGMTSQGAGRLGRIILPFVKTPVNITKFVTKRTPLGFLNPNLYRKTVPTATKIEELAKPVVGSAGIGALAWLSGKGAITGSAPYKKGEADANYRQGKQPYALKWGDRYISLKNMDPISSNIGIASDYSKYIKSQDPDEAKKAAYNVLNHVTNQSYLTGLRDVIDIATDEEKRNMNYFLGQQAGSFVPTIVKDIANIFDSEYKKPETRSLGKSIMEGVASRIPFVSNLVRPKRDLFGKEVKNEATWFGKLFNPSRVSKENISSVEQELNNLKVFPALPTKTIKNYKMNADEYDRYTELSGKVLESKLSKLVSNSGYQKLSDEKKEKLIKQYVEKSRQVARAKMISEMTKGMVRSELKSKLSELKEKGFLTKEVFNYYIKFK